MPVFAASTLQSFAENLFRAAGVPDDEAQLVAASLVEANLCGHDSHGVIRIMQYVNAICEGKAIPGAAFNIIKETAGVLHADAGWGLGQVQAHRLLCKLIPKARQVGLAAGTLKQCGHIGRLGEYAEAATTKGMAFMATVNGHGLGRGVAPPGGTQPCIGTNPLCLAAPGNGPPLILDIGTSVVAEGKIRVAFNKGQQVPEGMLLDAEGKPTTDPGVLYREPRGSLLPLGETQAYKGFGLGLLLDVFAGALSGGRCSHPDAPNLSANAVFFLVLDPAAFAGADFFQREVTALAENIRACPRVESVHEITLPGDPERREKEKRSRAGISMDEGTWNQLKELAERLQVAAPVQTIGAQGVPEKRKA